MTFRKLSLSSIANAGNPIIGAISAFLVSPVLIHSLGKENYGLWLLAFSIVGYLGILDLGMNGTAIRFLSAAGGESERSRFAATFGSFRRFYHWVGGILCAISLVFGGIGLFQPAGSTARELFLLMAPLGFLMGITFVFRSYASLLRANLNYHQLTLITGGRVILFTVAVLALGSQLDLQRLVTIYAALVTAEQLAIFFLGRKQAPAEPSRLSREEWKPVFQHASKNVVGQFAGTLRWRTDKQVVAGFVSLAGVTQYGIGVRIPFLFFQLVTALFGSQFIAAFSRLANERTREEQAQLLRMSLQVCTAISFAGGTVLFFLTPPFIERWLGPGFSEAQQVAQVLLPAWAVLASMSPINCFLTAIGKHGRIVTASIAGAFLNVILSLILVHFFGLIGVVYATAVEFVLLAIAYPWFGGKSAGLRPVPLLVRSFLLPCLTFGLLVVPPASWLIGILQPQTYWEIAIAALAIGLWSVVASLLGIIDSTTRKTVLKKVRDALQ